MYHYRSCAVNKTTINSINAALYKILKVDRVNMKCLRGYLNIPSVATSIERRRLRFMNIF